MNYFVKLSPNTALAFACTPVVEPLKVIVGITEPLAVTFILYTTPFLMYAGL